MALPLFGGRSAVVQKGFVKDAGSVHISFGSGFDVIEICVIPMVIK
jgi:hypothetical protein